MLICCLGTPTPWSLAGVLCDFMLYQQKREQRSYLNNCAAAVQSTATFLRPLNTFAQGLAKRHKEAADMWVVRPHGGVDYVCHLGWHLAQWDTCSCEENEEPPAAERPMQIRDLWAVEGRLWNVWPHQLHQMWKRYWHPTSDLSFKCLAFTSIDRSQWRPLHKQGLSHYHFQETAGKQCLKAALGVLEMP